MTKAPIHLQELRRRMYLKAKAEPSWRFWGLFVHVCKMETLEEAYREAKRKDGAPGIDGVSFQDVERSGRQGFLEQIRHELLEGTYQPLRNRKKEILGYGHNIVMISVVGTELTLPFDVEPYGPGDGETSAGQRLLRRAVKGVGVRFADYVVADGEYARAPFLHVAGELGLKVVVRLKGNVPSLFEAAQRRWDCCAPTCTFRNGPDWVELWEFSILRFR